MRYLVKCLGGCFGEVQVVARDVPHVIEASRVMTDQGLLNLVIEDTRSGLETTITDFLMEQHAGAVVAPTAPTA